jgi:hypothetical protein
MVIKPKSLRAQAQLKNGVSIVDHGQNVFPVLVDVQPDELNAHPFFVEPDYGPGRSKTQVFFLFGPKKNVDLDHGRHRKRVRALHEQPAGPDVPNFSPDRHRFARHFRQNGKPKIGSQQFSFFAKHFRFFQSFFYVRIENPSFFYVPQCAGSCFFQLANGSMKRTGLGNGRRKREKEDEYICIRKREKIRIANSY